MSRSNGPATRAGGHPPQWRHPAADGGPRPGHPAPQPWPQQQAEHPQYGYQDAGAPHQGGDGQYPAYHYPADGSQAGHPPYFGPAQPASAPAPSPYAPPFEPYPGAAAHGTDAYSGQEPARAPDPAVSLRDQLRAAHYDQWQSQSQRPYDLASYMPSAHGAAPAQPGYGYQAPAGPGAHDGHWPGHDAHWPGHDAHGFDPHAATGYYSEQPGASLPVNAELHDHDDGDYDEEPARGGRRGVMIVASLVGAIVVGGGLAYAYKTVLGSSARGTPPVIKADSRPVKVQPADPGGKQFAHSDMKLMGRLEPETPAASASSADPDAGVRRVSTVTIGRDGTISAPPPEPRLPAPTVSVPGLTIVDGGGPRVAPVARAPEPPRTLNVAAAAAASAQPSPVVAKTPAAPLPAAEPEALAGAAKRPAAQPPAPAPPQTALAVPVAPQRPAARAPAPEPPPPKQAAPAPSSAAGYVAVLSSQRSRMDALKTFADLQQKYADVLRNKIPDVQEADLSARGLGTMYRAVVGPPGSREAASDICGQLKSAGYTGCWVTAY